MANIKSAKKRILVNETKAARNKSIRSKDKTAMKKVDAAVAAGDKAAAQAALLAATSEIDTAASTGVYHTHNASRTVLRQGKRIFITKYPARRASDASCRSFLFTSKSPDASSILQTDFSPAPSGPYRVPGRIRGRRSGKYAVPQERRLFWPPYKEKCCFLPVWSCHHPSP